MYVDEPIIFIDIDGVTGDLQNHLEAYTGKELRDFSQTTSFAKLLGMTNHELAHYLDNSDFWESVPLTLWAYELVSFCDSFYKTYFLTTIISPFGNAGRVQWLQKHFPIHYEEGRYIFAHHKWLLARSNRCLIDDYEKNVRLWSKADGCPILFPADWNHLKHIKDPLDYIKGALEDFQIF
jgi:hypothetical protein